MQLLGSQSEFKEWVSFPALSKLSHDLSSVKHTNSRKVTVIPIGIASKINRQKMLALMLHALDIFHTIYGPNNAYNHLWYNAFSLFSSMLICLECTYTTNTTSSAVSIFQCLRQNWFSRQKRDACKWIYNEIELQVKFFRDTYNYCKWCRNAMPGEIIIEL